MAKQPEEGGVWDGERTGASFGTGTRFRHEGGVEELLLPDGITSTGSTQEEVVLALCHYNVGTLHGSQLSCIRGMSRRWGLEISTNRDRELNNFTNLEYSVLQTQDKMTQYPNNILWILTGRETLLPAVKRAPAS